MDKIEFKNNLAPYINADNLNKMQNNIEKEFPTGSVITWITNTAPTGFLFCEGQAVSRTTYSNLFAVLGTLYGSGDGSTTFNLPNRKGKVGVGYDSSQTEFNSIGKTGGSKYLQEHYHKAGYCDNNWTINSGAGTQQILINVTQNINTTTAGTGNSGNLQPYITERYIIKY